MNPRHMVPAVLISSRHSFLSDILFRLSLHLFCRYQCNVANKAGAIVINLTLEVYLRSRNEMQEPRNLDRGSSSIILTYSGETIAGIVFGILLIVLMIFLFVILAVMRYKESIIPSSLQSSPSSSCFTKCLLHRHHRRDHHSDQQSAGAAAAASAASGVDRHNNKIGIIENPAASRTNNNMTTSLSSSEGRRVNGSLSRMTNGSKYGSFDVISMMTANNHYKIMSGSQQQQQDIDSGHEEGSYESRVSVVTSGRSQSNSANLLISGIIREEADGKDEDDLSVMRTMSNDVTQWRERDHDEEEEEEEGSLRRPKVKALEVQGKNCEKRGAERRREKGDNGQ